MSHIRASFEEAERVTRTNPLLFGVILLAAIAVAGTLLVAGYIRFVGLALTLPFVGVFQAGVVGAVAVAHRDETAVTLGGFIETVSRYWKSIIGAYLSMIIAAFVLVTLLFEAISYVGAGYLVGGGALRSGDPGFLSASAIIGIVIIILFLAVLVVGALVVQFLDVAVVVGNHNATSAYSEAIGLVTEKPASVLGYSVSRLLIVGAGFLPPLIVRSFGITLPIIGIGLGLPVGFVTVLLALAFQWVFHTHYYLHRRQVRS